MLVLICAGCQPNSTPDKPVNFLLAVGGMSDGATVLPAQVYDQNGCKGSNQSPALHWSNTPAPAKSFAVTIFDPDAGGGKGWWHWAAYNLPASATDLAAGAGSADGRKLPTGAIQATNDFGTVGYGGPCPPPGDAPHHYVVSVYAVDVPTLPLTRAADASSVASALQSHTLAKATLTLRYGR